MFDFAWTEIALIGIVALIAIGPKDMPVAIKAVAAMIKKARRMASEFQVHVDEMVREANLHEMRDQIKDIRNMDIKGKIMSAVDGDGSIRQTMNTPLVTPSYMTDKAADLINVPGTEPHVFTEPPVTEAVTEAVTGPPVTEPKSARDTAPAFIPPQVANAEPPPAFIPPGAVKVRA